MRKRRLTKSEKATLEKIHSMQMTTLFRLKERAEVLIKSSDDILKKVADNGINHHYSKNSDVLRYAQELWSACLRLGELKAMCNDLEYTYGKKNK